MIEYFVNALVLGQKSSGELDKTIYLYTKELGKVSAKAKSIRKITSKSAGHLEPLNFVKARLIEKNGFQIADAITSYKIKKSLEALSLIKFIKEMTFDLHVDKKFWTVIKKSLEDLNNGKFSYIPLLKSLGFDPSFGSCASCHKKITDYFSLKEHVFLCKHCALKIKGDSLIYINNNEH